MTTRVDRNLAASLAASTWAGLINLAVIPLYIRHLGLEGYGLVGFLATMQALIQVLDLGLSTTINREIAGRVAAGSLTGARVLLRTVAAIYWAIAATIAVAFLALAPPIAEFWLSAERLTERNVATAVGLIGLVIACRWPGQLYQSALMGMQRHVVSSALNAASATLAAAGALLVLTFVSSNVRAFFAWQAFVALIYVMAVSHAAWRILGREGRRIDRRAVNPIWRFSAGVAAINITGIALAHMDKLLLSRILPLQDYGQYMVAFAVASVLYLFTTPVYNVIYPRFASLVQLDDRDRLAETYHLSTRLMAAIAFPLAMFLSVFAGDVVWIWTGDAAVASQAAALMPMLAVGVALHGVMHMPYGLQLAHGMTWLSLMTNFILLLVLFPTVIALASSFGAGGGAWAWLFFQVLYLFLGSWLTHRKILQGDGARWLVGNVGLPFAITLLMGLIASWVAHRVEVGPWVRILLGGVLAFATLTLIVAASPTLRLVLMRRFRDRVRPLGC